MTFLHVPTLSHVANLAREIADSLPVTVAYVPAIVALTALADGICPAEERPQSRPASSPADTIETSRALGYTGDVCPDCGSLQMVRNGACLKCDSCGATTGCS